MANRRQLVKRRKAVRNIRKITRTMQLIATARFQAMHKKAQASKPYSHKLAELVGSLSQTDVVLEDSLLTPHSEDPRDAILILTSKRGMCGSYNANVLKAAIAHLNANQARTLPTETLIVGRKGINYFKFIRRPIDQGFAQFAETLAFEEVKGVADQLMARFIAGDMTSVHVAYMRFLSAGKQTPDVVQLLPIAREEKGEAAAMSSAQYDFMPAPEVLLKELLPASVRIRLYQCFLDAVVSEQIARMVAMKAATDSAGDMIRTLTRQYNRARQTSITMELLDIIGGTAALE